MVHLIINSCGAFFVPQLLLSITTVTIIFAYGLAFFRGELEGTKRTWEKALDPLAAVAVGVGLLGSVVSFCVAFSGVKETSFEVNRIAAGLTTAYMTTAVGLVTSLKASLTSWLLGVVVKPKPPAKEARS